MTPTQIKKARELLAKREEALALRGRDGRKVGEIVRVVDGTAVSLQTDCVSLATLERWIKQIKAATKKGIV